MTCRSKLFQIPQRRNVLFLHQQSVAVEAKVLNVMTFICPSCPIAQQNLSCSPPSRSRFHELSRERSPKNMKAQLHTLSEQMIFHISSRPYFETARDDPMVLEGAHDKNSCVSNDFVTNAFQFPQSTNVERYEKIF